MAELDTYNYGEALRRLADQHVEGVFKAAFISGGVAEEPASAIAAVQRAMSQMPPREIWVVSSMLTPLGSATRHLTPGENITVIHPIDWPAVEQRIRLQLEKMRRTFPLALAPNPLFLDPSPCETLKQLVHRTRERDRLLDRIASALSVRMQLREVFGAP